MDDDIPKGQNKPTGTTQPNLPPNAPSATLNANTGDLNNLPNQNNNFGGSNNSQGVNSTQQNTTTNQNAPTNQNAEIEIQKERIKAEFNLREQKLNELRELLKAGVITFDEYMRGIKEI
jgi:hypothetical protein